MLFIISGPSCVGKSFAVEYLCGRFGFKTLIPYTTRKPRDSESEGVHYHFRSEKELRELSGNFSRGYWAQPLDQNWYGYSSHVGELSRDPGNWIIQAYSDIALSIKESDDQAYIVFLDYQSNNMFTKRLAERYGTNEATRANRIKHSEHERSVSDRFDHVLRSDNPEHLADKLMDLLSRLVTEAPTHWASSTGPLTDTDIMECLRENNGFQIEGIDASELDKRIHGWSLDLTIAAKYYRVRKSRKLFDLADGNDQDMARRFLESFADPVKGIVLMPHEFVLASTNEKICLPRNIVGLVSGRSSYSRMGISVELSQIIVQPGHADIIPLQIRNNLPYPVRIYPNTSIVQIVFFMSNGLAREAYDHQASAKYRGRLADIRSRYYDDPVYPSIKEKKPSRSPIDWDVPLNVIILLSLIATASAWFVSMTHASTSNSAKLLAIGIFVFMILMIVIRIIRLVIAGRKR